MPAGGGWITILYQGKSWTLELDQLMVVVVVTGVVVLVQGVSLPDGRPPKRPQGKPALARRLQGTYIVPLYKYN